MNVINCADHEEVNRLNNLSRLAAVLVVLFTRSHSFAGGGQPRLSPFGVPYSDTVTLHCQSGRNILFFSGNTQAVNLFYEGKVSRLADLPYNRDIRYSTVGLKGMGDFEHDQLGPGLEWRSTVKSGSMWEQSALYRVVQHRGGKRTLTLLERCKG